MSGAATTDRMSLDALEAEFLRLRLIDYLLDVEWDVSEGDLCIEGGCPDVGAMEEVSRRLSLGARAWRAVAAREYPLDSEARALLDELLAHATRNVEHDHAASRRPAVQDVSADDDLDESLEQAGAIAALCRRVDELGGEGGDVPS